MATENFYVSAALPRPKSSTVLLMGGVFAVAAAIPRPNSTTQAFAADLSVTAATIGRPSAAIAITAPEAGDLNSDVTRLLALLPQGWFPPDGTPTAAPILLGLRNGFASMFAWLVSLLNYASAQDRIPTSTDIFLDVAALDFLGTSVARRPAESDASFAARIQWQMNTPRGTRAALVQRLTLLTGVAPIVMEPSRVLDAGAYANVARDGQISQQAFYGASAPGRYGSLQYPYQLFITAYQPTGAGGIPVGSVSVAEIYATVAQCVPASTIAWVKVIENPLTAALGSFVLDVNTLA